ncbi:Ankyrin-1 [Drechslerella dactyloides]|uniref:Ankyrin-1 n=1 Tax=Drechslerella dactyloides TaxID=74499 RepID=A0AAD6IS63_DREDA|nr:Ankyrin-1 [Drechslerella dactyloides]
MALDSYFSTLKYKYTDEDFERISDLLQDDAGLQKYSKAPRLYSILRQMGHLSDFDDLLRKGFSESSLPLHQTQLPGEFSDKWKNHFVETQESICRGSDIIGLFRLRKHGNFLQTPSGLHSQRVIATTALCQVDVVYTFLDGAKYYARKQYFRREMALSDTNTLRAFEHEVQIMKSIVHRHCVKLEASYTDDKFFTIIMSPFAQYNLTDYLKKAHGNEDLRSFLPQFFGCLSRGLWFLHFKKIHHRDIKPENILINEHNVFLADFDCSYSWANKTRSTTNSAPTRLTHKWAAPEVLNAGFQTDNRINSLADIWSLGCVFLEIATVIKRKSIVELERRIDEAPSGDSSFCANVEVVKRWMEELQEASSTHNLDNEPLGWIQRMLKLDQDERPSAHRLVEMIGQAKNPSHFYCVDCFDDARDFKRDNPTSTGEETRSHSEINAAVLLLNNNFDIRASNFDALEAFRWATGHRQDEVVRLIIRKTLDINAVGSDRPLDPALCIAAENGHHLAVELLLKKGAGVNIARKDGWTALHLAALNNFTSIIKLLYENGADTESKTTLGVTPLHVAVKNGHSETARLLLEGDANVNAKDLQGWTPLQFSAVRGEEAAIRLLIEHGATLEEQNNQGRTALIEAAYKSHETVVKLLVEKGADINTITEGRTLLQHAAKEGDQRLAWLLLESGADVEKNDDGWTPLHIAVQGGRESVVQVLLAKNADVHKRKEKRETALHLASASGNILVIRSLIKAGAELEAKDDREWTPLIVAVTNGCTQAVKTLLENKSNVHTTTDNQWTALHFAANLGKEAVISLLLDYRADCHAKIDNGSTPLHLAAHQGHAPIVQLLLDSGKVNPELQDNYGWTPLHRAVEAGHVAVLRILSQNGADIHARLKGGGTALHLASMLHNNSEQVLRLLLNSEKANPELRDDLGSTALHRAAEGGQVTALQILIENGADIHAKMNGGWTALHVAASKSISSVLRVLIDSKKADLETQDDNKWTALHRAVESGHESIVQLLVDSGANLEAKTRDGWTPLCIAFAKYHEEIASLLIGKGADVNCRLNQGWTLLQSAAEQNRMEMVSLLLAKGADIDAYNNFGCTPLVLATARGHEPMVRLLLENKANPFGGTMNGRLAYKLAVDMGNTNIQQLLIDHGGKATRYNANCKIL